MRLRDRDALLIVDMQRDFLPGGSLAVPGGDEAVGPLNACAATFDRLGLPVYASRDWHPANHCSFVEQGGPWPPHCIANTEGAALTPALSLPDSATIIDKAMRPDADAYSAFDGTVLDSELREAGVRRLFIGGVATDYCVRATALDARLLGYEVVLLRDAVRAIDIDDGLRALAMLRREGVSVEDSDALRGGDG
jgi:nicotinamidase/pyrazinamidase